MASGFGTFTSSSYVTKGSQKAYARAKVSQSVNKTARTVTIRVRCLLTCNRVSGNWTVPSGTSIFSSSTGSNTIQATLDGSTATAGAGGKLGLKGTGRNISAGGWYDTDGVIENGQTVYYVAANNYAAVEKSITFSYNSAGNAITKSWSVKISYSGTTMTCSGNVTTDSIPAAGNAPSEYTTSDIVPEWDRITFTSICGNPGTGSLNSHCPSIQKEPLVGGRQKYENTNSGGTQPNIITSTVSNNSSPINNPTWKIQGCGFYYTGAYLKNTSELVLYGNGDSTYTPPAPGIIDYSFVKNKIKLSYTGDSSKNNASYDKEHLTRTIRYKKDSSDWVYVRQNTQNLITDKTEFYINLSDFSSLIVEAYMTYHDLMSEVSQMIFNSSSFDYKLMGQGTGTFDNSVVKFDKIYTSVNQLTKNADKVYISINNKAVRIH